MRNGKPQKETARLLEQPSRECKTPKAQFFKESQMNHSTSPCCLQFESVTFNVIDRNGQPWLRVGQIAQAFGYKDHRDCSKLYARNADEFSDSMCSVVKLPTAGGVQEVRIFSLRGAHLLAMFARTPKAQAFRRWVLDILDKEVGAGETAPSSRLTYDTMSKAVLSYANQYGRSAAKAALRHFGSGNLPGVPESRWAELYAMLQYPPGNATSLQAVEERLRFSRFLLRFDPVSGQPQLSEIGKNACIIDPDNPSELQTFINEFVRFEQIPVVLQAATNRVSLCYQAVRDKAALPAPTPEPKPRTTGRPWKDPAQAEELLKSMRFRLEEMYDFSLITPERVEELHKANVIGPRQMVKLKRLMAA